MKIIRMGNVPLDCTIKYTCGRCGCIFTYNEKDIERSAFTVEPHIHCPCCNLHINLKYDGYPNSGTWEPEKKRNTLF